MKTQRVTPSALGRLKGPDPRRSKHWLLAVAMLFTFLGGLSFTATVSAAPNKVEVCHELGNGDYRLIEVAAKALPAHLGHGDALPGEPVPGQPNLVFDGTCSPVDITPPVVNVPADVVAEAASSDGAVVSYVASATDAVDGAVDAVCDVASGAVFPLGETTVTCTAADASGNTGTSSFVVDVVDTTGPVVNVPADVVAEAASSDGAVVSYVASATDAVDGAVDAVCDVAPGAVFPLGETTVTCTAVDGSGNTGSASFVVNVVDITPPVVNVPADVVAEAASSDGAVVSYVASATDAVDGAVDAVCDVASGAVFPLGETTVTCTAADASGNTGTSSFAVNVVDTVAPVIAMPQGGAFPALQLFLNVTATDAIDGPVDAVCDNDAAFPIGETTIVNCTATDSSGNTGTLTFSVAISTGGFGGNPNTGFTYFYECK